MEGGGREGEREGGGRKGGRGGKRGRGGRRGKKRGGKEGEGVRKGRGEEEQERGCMGRWRAYTTRKINPLTKSKKIVQISTCRVTIFFVNFI